MKKILICISLLLFVIMLPVWGQNQDDNLIKYWKYRDRLRNKFMVVDEHVERHGTNIPAADIFYNSGEISWGDANSNMSHYLSMLATELWLLKHNNQNYSETLKELYYAMMAMERLDTYSEYNLRWKENKVKFIDGVLTRGYVDEKQDINGFHLRDDVSRGFWNYYKDHFDVPNFMSIFIEGNMQEFSQDNIYHNLEGLSLVGKLVGTESVEGIPIQFVNDIIPERLTRLAIKDGENINFSLWAQDFVKRYIRYMQNDEEKTVSLNGTGVTTHWYLDNPVTEELVREGSGSDLDMCTFYHYGVIKSGEQITGENLRLYKGLTNQPEKIYNDLFRNHTVDLSDQVILLGFIIEQFYGGNNIDVAFDDYKLRSMSCIGDVLGRETYTILRKHRDTYPPFIYEHFPLMYLVLHDEDYNVMGLEDDIYNTDKVFYEDLLNSAPLCGPASDRVHEWSETSRCVWPERLGQNANQHIEYSGLDYMMLHNLYYIAFRKEDYKKIIVDDTSIYRYISANAGIIEANSPILGNNITYTATNDIIFGPDFSAPGELNFEYRIEPRSNNYQGRAYIILNEKDCDISARPEFIYSDSSDYKNTSVEFFEPVKILKKPDRPLTDTSSWNLNITIFPNPNKGIFKIFLTNTKLPLKYSVFNVNSASVGKGLIEMELAPIDISYLPEGIYFIRFYNVNKTVTKKITLLY